MENFGAKESIKLNSVSIRTDNSENGIKLIGELNYFIATKKLNVISEGNHALVTYSDYESDDKGEYTYTIKDATTADIADLVSKLSDYKEISVCGDTPQESVQNTWKVVWEKERNRAFTVDYEITTFSKTENKFITRVFVAMNKQS